MQGPDIMSKKKIPF